MPRCSAAARSYYSRRVGTETETIAAGAGTEPPSDPPRRRIAVSTAIFAVATAFSRVAGLGREVVAAGFFGTTAAASAFTIASQVPNLFSNLFSQAALSAAFVPVFTELLHHGRKQEAFRLASTLFWIILIGLGALTVVWMAVATAVVPLFTGGFHASTNVLTAGLSRVLFPVVLLLSLTGLLVGILQSYDEFTIPALAPAVWNLVILVLLVVLHSHFHGGDALYAYAIAWLVATVVQLLMVGSALRRIDFRLRLNVDWHDPRVPDLHAAPGRVQRGGRDRAVSDAESLGGAARRRGHASHARQRNAADQPAADPMRGAAAGAGHSDHTAGLPAGRFQRAFDASRLHGPVLVRVQPSVRRGQPAAEPDVLRAQAALDPDPPGDDQHRRRHPRQPRAVQAVRARGAGDRHGRRQRGDDVAAAAPAPDRIQRPA